ncbi:hypothetical protein J7K43_07655 [Candidatus Calescamantes bacterium]|nr:hypothetical protein [Candidatus Calescamantes bacterium]
MEEKFYFERIGECFKSLEGKDPGSGIDLHRGYYPSKFGGYELIEVFVSQFEVVGVRVSDAGTGTVYLELGEIEEV